MTHELALYWSFRSPYSYLATGRIVGLAEAYDLEIAVRPVYPIAIRTPEFFQKAHPLWVRYLRRDVRRIAEKEGIPFAWPQPDPVVMDMETRRVAPEQPYIHRLTHLGIAAARRGRGLAFIDEVSKLIWSGAVRGWHEGDHLHEATARAGLDLKALDQAIAEDPQGHDEAVSANQARLEEAGHWGVPTLVFEGEPFFGQDRIDLCLWRMQQRGLKRR